jgi:hypothetical protein
MNQRSYGPKTVVRFFLSFAFGALIFSAPTSSRAQPNKRDALIKEAHALGRSTVSLLVDFNEIVTELSVLDADTLTASERSEVQTYVDNVRSRLGAALARYQELSETANAVDARHFRDEASSEAPTYSEGFTATVMYGIWLYVTTNPVINMMQGFVPQDEAWWSQFFEYLQVHNRGGVAALALVSVVRITARAIFSQEGWLHEEDTVFVKMQRLFNSWWQKVKFNKSVSDAFVSPFKDLQLRNLELLADQNVSPIKNRDDVVRLLKQVITSENCVRLLAGQQDHKRLMEKVRQSRAWLTPGS